MLRAISTELRAVARGPPFPAVLLSPPCTLQRFAGCPFRPVCVLRHARSSASRCRSRAALSGRSAFFALHAPALRAVARGLAAFPAGLLSPPCTLQRFALSLAGCPFRPVCFLRHARSSASRCRSRAGALSGRSAFFAMHAPALRAVARGLAPYHQERCLPGSCKHAGKTTFLMAWLVAFAKKKLFVSEEP